MLKRFWRQAVEQGKVQSSDKAQPSDKTQPQDKAPGLQPQAPQPLSVNYDANLQALRQIFNLCPDIVFHEFIINSEEGIRAFIVYASSLCDHRTIGDQLMKSILPDSTQKGVKITKANAVEVLKEKLISLAEVDIVGDLQGVEDKVLQGNAALLVEGSAQAIIANARGGEKRAISEPDTEPSIRGPKDGFVEDFETNMTLIRRRIKTSRLKFMITEKGKLTKTKIAICYIEGVANPQVVDEVRQRIERINNDSVLEGNYIEENIMDEKFSLFPLIQYTERPDKACSCLLQGRVLILIENSNMPLIVPTTFIAMLQAAEDYYHNSLAASTIRILRFIALNMALLLPAVTVAVFSFHQELLPPPLVSTVAGARQGLPLSISLEIILFEFTFELLREAGVRLPKTIGQAISTVGCLFICDAAVNAGVVSPISVIVVAITAIASFSVPNFEAAFSLRILRFSLILAASVLGGIGIVFGLMIILIHLCSLRSFGVPYLAPFAPLIVRDLKDSIVRVPWWALNKRPRTNRTPNVYRKGKAQGPRKPKKGGGQS